MQLSKNEFAQYLRKAIGSRPLSQVARESGLNRQQLARYLKGEALPRADAFMRLCEALAIDPHDAFKTKPAKRLAPLRALPGYEDYLEYSTFKPPGQNELPDGNYRLFHRSAQRNDRFIRAVLKVSTHQDQRLFLLRQPSWLFKHYVPRSSRDIAGVVFCDQFENCQFYGLWRDTDTKESTLHVIFAGPRHSHHGHRPALFAVPDNIPMNAAPLAARAALVYEPNSSLRKLFAETKMIEPSELPSYLHDFFFQPNKTPSVIENS